MVNLAQAGHVDIHKPASCHFHSIIIMEKYGDDLDVGLVRLMSTKYEGLGDLQSSVLIFVLVLHNCSAPFIDIRLVCVYLHQPLSQLYYHLRTCHKVVFLHRSPFQADHQALV
jgi:hypothetical protein